MILLGVRKHAWSINNRSARAAGKFNVFKAIKMIPMYERHNFQPVRSTGQIKWLEPSILFKYKIGLLNSCGLSPPAIEVDSFVTEH